MSIADDHALSDALGRLLPNVIAFYLNAHGAHWNVEGSDFPEYHAFFQEIYSDVYESIDPLAESIRKLGDFPRFHVSDIAEESIISDKARSTSSWDFVDSLALGNTQILTMIGECLDLANAANQQGILNFLAERQDMHQKWAWQLRASQQ